MLFFSTWIIILSDMVKNKIYNKTFWIMTMFILPFISPIFYLIQRNRLIRLGQKF
ncbi:PLDc N-terminal domain-containing protein [Aequorivita sp. KMM 9714]|uniref:PLDc N-terminal domain-containing protein n=1 Tax=Aequorivita sp. KMM 9714 TaxID=2707173 RepID=UPI0024112BE6|nr:PLDc N-terminal domain-containing protein [Aequorivita sp. KMM 9714]